MWKDIKKVYHRESIYYFSNVQEIIDYFNVDPKKIILDGEEFVIEETVKLSELDQYKSGRKVLRDKEIKRRQLEKKKEKELKELQRLKKKYEER